jgi:hypothetical protein
MQGFFLTRTCDGNRFVTTIDGRYLGAADDSDVVGTQFVEGLQDDGLFNIVLAEATGKQGPRVIAIIFSGNYCNLIICGV